jgi:hypothetical protein
MIAIQRYMNQRDSSIGNEFARKKHEIDAVASFALNSFESRRNLTSLRFAGYAEEGKVFLAFTKFKIPGSDVDIR